MCPLLPLQNTEFTENFWTPLRVCVIFWSHMTPTPFYTQHFCLCDALVEPAKVKEMFKLKVDLSFILTWLPCRCYRTLDLCAQCMLLLLLKDKEESVNKVRKLNQVLHWSQLRLLSKKHCHTRAASSQRFHGVEKKLQIAKVRAI